MPILTRAGAGLACALLFAASARGQEMTEAQVVEVIMRDGLQARAIRLGAEVVRREQAARTTLTNPAVAYSRESAGFTEFLQVEQFLPVFGSRGALLKASAAAAGAAEAERDGRLWQLRADARAFVARLLAEQEKLGAAMATVHQVERIIMLLRVREQEGEGSRFDRMRAEQELAEARQVSLDAAASGADARAAIGAVASEGARVTRVSGTLYVDRAIPPVDALITRAMSTRAELRALRASIDRFSLEADAARRTRLPEPTIAGGMKRAGDGARRENGGVMGISMTVPFFDSGRREAARWLAERDRTEAEQAWMTQTIQAQVGAAAEVLALRQDAIRSLEAGSSPDEVGRIAEVSYIEGEAGILELLDAHRTVARARIRGIEMRLAARVAQIALERVVGDTIWP